MRLRNYFWTILFVVGIMMPQMLGAFPSEAEIKTATSVVGDLVAEDVRAANAGKAKREDVANKIYGYVDQAETDAAKWVLLKHAFIQYAKDGNFEKAGSMMSEAIETFPDVSPQTVITLIEKNCPKVSAKNAPALTKIRNVMTMRLKCKSVLANAKASKMAKAESQCLMGDWKKGLTMLKEVGGKVGEIAAAEADGSLPKHKIADFWWEYKSEPDTCDQFKAHAAEIYKAGLADGSITGLYKPVAEKRIAEIEAMPVVVATEPKSAGVCDLANLKKICNTRGLVHCWRFNGNLKDCIGGGEAQLTNSAVLDKGCVSYPRSKSNIDLGPQMLPKEGDFTLELWVKPNSFHPYSRMFVFGKDAENRFLSLWRFKTGDDAIEVIYKNTNDRLTPAFGPFEMGVEYHLAVVFKRDGKNFKMTAYRQDAKTGTTLSKRFMVVTNGWSPSAFEHVDSWLGANYHNDDSANASYNEVRIWKRALSEQELTQNAIKFHKAGETIK